jgi:hypothetical protein
MEEGDNWLLKQIAMSNVENVGKYTDIIRQGAEMDFDLIT